MLKIQIAFACVIVTPPCAQILAFVSISVKTCSDTNWWCCYNTCGSNLDLRHSKYINYSKLASMFKRIKTQWVWILTFWSSNSFFLTNGFEPPLVSTLLFFGERDCGIWWVTKLDRNLVYVKRVLIDFLKIFQEEFSCPLVNLFIESYLHVHANLILPNFDTQNFSCGKHASLS